MTEHNRTLAIAERVSAIRYADLNTDTVAMVKRLIADGVAVAIAGSLEEPPRILFSCMGFSHTVVMPRSFM